MRSSIGHAAPWLSITLALVGAACDQPATQHDAGVVSDASIASTDTTCVELCEAQIDADCRFLGTSTDPCDSYCEGQRQFAEGRGCGEPWDALVDCWAAAPTCWGEDVYCASESDAMRVCLEDTRP